jgi:hypothetical protein
LPARASTIRRAIRGRAPRTETPPSAWCGQAASPGGPAAFSRFQEIEMKGSLTGRLVLAATMLAAPAALHAQSEPNPAYQAYAQAMAKMADDTKAMTSTGDPDMDFVMMMKPHHQAAVEMAKTYLKYGHDPKLTGMAHDIITSQQLEIAEMEDWQSKHGM